MIIALLFYGQKLILNFLKLLIMIERVEVATKIILVSNDQKALIVKRSSEDSFASWEFDLPWGRLELWENPLDWASRELYEETSIIFKNFLPLKTWSFNKENLQIIGITYIGHIELPYQEIQVRLSSEHSDFKWVCEEEIEDMDLPKWLKLELNLAFNY